MTTDPTDSDFNPLYALYSEDNGGKQFEGAKTFDNIAVFEGHLKKKQLNPKTSASTSKTSKSFSKRKKVQVEAKNRDLEKLKHFMELRRKQDLGEDAELESGKEEPGTSGWRKKKRNLMMSMEKLSIGPFGLLQRIVKDHLRCNVYIRDFCGLRGVCSGYVVAFDRYMNLAMVDVDETFRKPPVGKVAAHQKTLSVSLLCEAINNMNKDLDQYQQTYRHNATTGVQTRRKKVEIPNKDKQQIVKMKHYAQFVKPRTFHGGMPLLYHRHANHMLVRGDSIVIVTLKE